jgi:hypothetical protein
MLNVPQSLSHTQYHEDISFILTSELKFDDTLILQNLFSKLFNHNTNDILVDFKNFNHLLLFHRSFIKLNKIPSNDYIVILKIHFLLEIKKINFIEEKLNPKETHNHNLTSSTNNILANSTKFSVRKDKDSISYQVINTVSSIKEKENNTTHTPDSINSANKLSNSECNDISYAVYSLLFDINTNEIKINLLDSVTHIILGEFIGIGQSNSQNNNVTFEKFMNLIEGNNYSTNNNSSNENTNSIKALLLPKISFEIFLKYFKILIFFYFYSDNYKRIFTILDPDFKQKILTAELVVTFNKLTRNLEENNIFIIFTKKFLGLLDNNQIYLSKIEYFTILIKSLSI